MGALIAFRLTEIIIALALALQFTELLRLRALWNDDGIWSWPLLRTEYAWLPSALKAMAELVFRPSGFQVLLCIGLLSALALLVFPLEGAAIVLFTVAIAIAIRWRGAFNGGADSMTLQVLLVLSVLQFFRDRHAVLGAGLSYLAIQASTSYFVGGLVKLKSRDWREGRALPAFVASSVHGDVAVIARHRWLTLGLSWCVILFECSFPLALIGPRLSIPYVAVALCFHLGNFLIFGLNRFVWAWLAAYPALIYFSASH